MPGPRGPGIRCLPSLLLARDAVLRADHPRQLLEPRSYRGVELSGRTSAQHSVTPAWFRHIGAHTRGVDSTLSCAGSRQPRLLGSGRGSRQSPTGLAANLPRAVDVVARKVQRDRASAGTRLRARSLASRAPANGAGPGTRVNPRGDLPLSGLDRSDRRRRKRVIRNCEFGKVARCVIDPLARRRGVLKHVNAWDEIL